MKKRISHIICVLLLLQQKSVAQSPALNSYSAASATVYLDFNGGVVEGTLWNENGPIHAEPSGLTAATIAWIHKRVADHFTLFNLNITTDPAVYDRAPQHQRVRIIITPDGSWYGSVSGVSAIGSFVWGDDTPGWVFTHALSDNALYIAAAATHEIGHTLGLQHQSVYDSYGIMISELSGGENNIFSNQAPLMGIPFYKEAGWKTGHPSTGAGFLQNDTAVIAGSPNNIGYRKNPEEETSADAMVKVEKQESGSLELRSYGNYHYRIFDISGRLLTQGSLKTGFNQIPTSAASTGILVLQWSDDFRSGSQKIFQQ